jgi:hypothetical protein
LSVVIQIPIFKHFHPVTTEARLLALSSLLVMLMTHSHSQDREVMEGGLMLLKDGRATSVW